MDTAKKTTYFKECCLAYKQTPTDEGVVAKFYTLLGQVKLYVVLEYGVCQLRQTEAGSVLCAYTEHQLEADLVTVGRDYQVVKIEKRGERICGRRGFGQDGALSLCLGFSVEFYICRQ